MLHAFRREDQQQTCDVMHFYGIHTCQQLLQIMENALQGEYKSGCCSLMELLTKYINEYILVEAAKILILRK